MRCVAFFLFIFLAAPLWAQQQKYPEIPYRADPDFFKLPDGMYFGEGSGVAVDSKGNIYVVNRSNHPLMKFSPDGTFIRTIGDGLPIFGGPHHAAVDAQDNLWFVDAATNLLVRFNPQARLTMVLGRRPEEWTWETHVFPHAPTAHDRFYQPTDLAIGLDGSIYVTDGYGNSRVAKFDKDGKFLKDWGERGAAPGQFNTPHAIVIDSKGTVYVADRGNRRIQLFDPDGNFLKEWRNVGAPWGICITPGPNQVIFSADGPSGRIYKLDLNGNVLGAFGKPGHAVGQFGWVHGIACPSENVIYAAEELNFRVDKLTLQPLP